MSIEDLEDFINDLNINDINVYRAFDLTLNILKDQSDQIANLRQELAKKEDAINIGDVIKEARLRNG